MVDGCTTPLAAYLPSGDALVCSLKPKVLALLSTDMGFFVAFVIGSLVLVRMVFKRVRGY